VHEPTMTTAQLGQLAGKIGAELGMPLDAGWDGADVMLGTAGNGLHIGEPWNRPGHLSIAGRFPPTSYYFRGERASITIRASRGQTAIAREITRRLLPGYRATLAKVAEHDAAERADSQARAALAERITALFPPEQASLPSHCQSDTRSEVLIHSGGGASGWVKFHGRGEEVRLDLTSIPAGVAVRMLAIRADLDRRPAR
jgi:hypothetical protein